MESNNFILKSKEGIYLQMNLFTDVIITYVGKSIYTVGKSIYTGALIQSCVPYTRLYPHI